MPPNVEEMNIVLIPIVNRFQFRSHEVTFNIFIQTELKILFFCSTKTKAPLGPCADNVENNSFKLVTAHRVVFQRVARSVVEKNMRSWCGVTNK
jgi:hypothetical protein